MYSFELIFFSLELIQLFLHKSASQRQIQLVHITVLAKTIQLYVLPKRLFGCIIGNFERNFISIRRKGTQWPGPCAHKCQLHLCKPRLACPLGHKGKVISVQNSPNSLTFYLSSVMTFEAQFVCFSQNVLSDCFCNLQLHSTSYDEKRKHLHLLSMFRSAYFQMIFS